MRLADLAGYAIAVIRRTKMNRSELKLPAGPFSANTLRTTLPLIAPP